MIAETMTSDGFTFTRYRHCENCHSYVVIDAFVPPCPLNRWIIIDAGKLGQPVVDKSAARWGFYRKGMVDYRTLDQAQWWFNWCIGARKDYAIVNIDTGETWRGTDEGFERV